MTSLTETHASIMRFVELGGPVVGLILALSVVAGAIVIWKVWQFAAAGVGRHGAVRAALDAAAAGQISHAQGIAQEAPSYLAPILRRALAARPDARERLHAEAEACLARLTAGLRVLDTIAQVAPLLGLFGTVLGMIEAFRAMQDAGQNVDPSLLAGGIWVALMTTAAGLAVAMPTTAALAWLDGRVERERQMADLVIEAALVPGAICSERAAASRIAHA